MTDDKRNHVEDLRGASRLAIDAVEGVTSLVEEMHQTIGSGPAILGKPLERPMKAITGLVYGSVRGVARLVGAGIDAALAQLSPLLLAESEPGLEHDGTSAASGGGVVARDAVLAALNGVLGDYLAETVNPLAITMCLRHGGRRLVLERDALRAVFPEPRGRLIVLVHGSCMNDAQWLRKEHDHGEALARELALSPIYVRYNSGLHISDNGDRLAALLEELVLAWPLPVDEVMIVGHSMGGLVARSACVAAEAAGLRWRALLSKLVCLGTPHRGAVLERGGNWVDTLLGVSRYSAPFGRLGRIRSAGVTDLRHGYVLASEWRDKDRFARGSAPSSQAPLPAGVACYAIAGSLASDGAGSGQTDGLVDVASALGLHDDPARALAFPDDHRWTGYGLGHLDLLSSPEVYSVLRGWLAA
jgi:pimeloyl-ACP methyl ester carboxylesterase